MSKRISILGSTGSIGRQSLDVIAACGMEVAALTAHSSVKLVEEQARQFKPELVAMMDEQAAAAQRGRKAAPAKEEPAQVEAPAEEETKVEE